MIKEVVAVGILFEDESGQILVLLRHIDSHEGGKWGLVGGNVDAGENEIEAALREAREEIGYDIPASELIHLKSYKWGRFDMDITFNVFKYTTSKQTVRIELDTDENTQYMWISPQDLYGRQDLMIGLYPILKDIYNLF